MALDMNNFSTDMTEKEAVYSEKKLRIGIIGTGGIAHSHIKAYLHQPDVEIVAACDLIPGKAEKFLKEYEVEAPTFRGLQEDDRQRAHGRRQRLRVQPQPRRVHHLRSGAWPERAAGEAHDRHAGRSRGNLQG